MEFINDNRCKSETVIVELSRQEVEDLIAVYNGMHKVGGGSWGCVGGGEKMKFVLDLERCFT